MKVTTDEKIFDYVLNNLTLKGFLYRVKDMHLANSVMETVKDFLIYRKKNQHFRKFYWEHCRL